MKQKTDVIQEAALEFDAGLYSKSVLYLSLPDCIHPDYNGFNTIFRKEAHKLESFEYFRTIRKTASSNAYFHVPLCRTACLYCSYEKLVHPEEGILERYLVALLSEIRRKCSLFDGNFQPDIFYIGGGTPTYLNVKQMVHLLQILGQNFNLQDNLEFTVETNPKAILDADGLEKLAILKEAGVNRINVGVQSFSLQVTRLNGRHQTKRDICTCFERLRKVGFAKVNLDLIYGLIGQSLEVWQSDLQSAAELGPDSITTFALRVRPPSGLHTMVSRGQAILPSERELLIMRIMAQRFLPAEGYYEDNSDYFIKGPEKRYLYQPFQPHNINRNLIGFGPSAYSLAGNEQIFNVRPTREYIDRIEHGMDPVDCVISLNHGEYLRKWFAERLRTSFDDHAFQQEFGCSIYACLPGIMDKLEEWGLLTVKGSEVRLSFKGRILHDHIADYVKYCETF